MKSLVVVAVVVACAWTLDAQSRRSRCAGRESAAALQRHQGFQGDFVQTYEGGVLRTKTTERGTVAIKRPGRMRFTYTKPEKKEFVSDGTRLYTHLVADKQVIVSPAPRRMTATCRRCSSPASRTSPGLRPDLHGAARRCNRAGDPEARATKKSEDYESSASAWIPKRCRSSS